MSKCFPTRGEGCGIIVWVFRLWLQAVSGDRGCQARFDSLDVRLPRWPLRLDDAHTAGEFEFERSKKGGSENYEEGNPHGCRFHGV
jgi:hypothetical protein